jgi:hypothetical protein
LLSEGAPDNISRVIYLRWARPGRATKPRSRQPPGLVVFVPGLVSRTLTRIRVMQPEAYGRVALIFGPGERRLSLVWRAH